VIYAREIDVERLEDLLSDLDEHRATRISYALDEDGEPAFYISH
jgi:hypothetical protein